MDIPVLHGEKRDVKGTLKARKMRRAGKVPAVLYGHKEKNILLTLDPADLSDAVRAGAHMVQIDTGDAKESALIREIQHDVLHKEILHVDLFRVSMNEEIVVAVPVELRGTPAGVAAGAVLEHEMREVQVRCLASNVPDLITVNIRDMEIGEHIRVSDLKMPEGVTPEHDLENVVATLLPPRVEETPE